MGAIRFEGALAHFSSSTGLDFSRYELDEPIRYVKVPGHSCADAALLQDRHDSATSDAAFR